MTTRRRPLLIAVAARRTRNKDSIPPNRRRTFGFDAAAAEIYGELLARRAQLGRPLRGFDGLIAAIALSRGHGVATRNVDDFSDCGLQLVNPWD